MGTAEPLPDCRDVGLFRAQAQGAAAPNATTPEATDGDTNFTCLLRSGTAVVALLGSAEGNYLSPLRDPVRFAVPRASPAATKLDNSRVASFLLRVRQTLSRFSAFPWGDPAAVERFFFRRRFRVAFEIDASPGGMTSRNQLLSRAVFDRIRATSFAPTAELVGKTGNSSVGEVRLGCNFDKMLETYQGVSKTPSLISRMVSEGGFGVLLSVLFGGNGFANTISSTARNSGEASSGVLSSAELGTAYVFEELGPNGRSSRWLPSWVAAWLGTRPMASTEALLRGTEGRHQFAYEVELPVASPVCLRLAAAHAQGLSLHVEETLVFDIFWLKVMLLLCLIWFLQPWVEDVPAFQILLAGVGGIIVLVGFLLIFLFRKLQNMTLGKIGLLALVTMGGFSALAESLLSAYAAFIYSYFNYDENSDLIFHLTCVLLVIGLACGLFAKFFWASYLFSLTRWTLRWTQFGVIACAAMQNREATLLFLVVAFAFYPPRLLRFILWCSRSYELENRENEPQESFPGSARREVAYAPPLCVEGFIGGSRALSSEEKLRLYDALGNEYTQRALAHLADAVKEDPRRYASRLKNPKEVMNWARHYK
ncbi:uncharacterized protein Tco025E_05325 [Trypanosoma conorhini]|uniref:Transmembrane protein n=1 Tax=Trypanosoma conorhini TaxID=83891 RepID=A0A422PE14_9TRYP|nr:uncharacterized protein Tco025E_05325 [Trypanosoma conorhini]RNF15951.1 hypothetical protein Tco025E_05325 [Trypanosoma conorhini]